MENGSSSDETDTRPSIHALKSWDSMCESDGENHLKQRAARPAIANDNSATSVTSNSGQLLKMSRIAAISPLGEGIAQQAIVI
jgi:hypothetical protein